MTQLSGFGEPRPRKRSDLKQEIGSLVNNVRRFDFAPNTFVILVCRHGAIEGLTNKIHHKRQEKAFGQFKNVAIGVTDDIRLSAVISAAEKNGSYDNLVIIASVFISHLYFDIGFDIMDLKVLRCEMNDNFDDYLYLDGYSTFHEQPIRTWEAMSHEAKFWLGPGVVIDLDSHIGQFGNLSKVSSSMSDFDKEKVRSSIEGMGGVKMEGKWWESFKAPISTIVSILTSTAKLAHGGYIKMTSGGMFVEYKFVGFALFAGAAAASANAVSAGTALLVAPGVSAAIYFIPWDLIFGWLSSVASWLKIGIKKIWDRVRDWLATCASMIRDRFGGGEPPHGPSRFPA